MGNNGYYGKLIIDLPRTEENKELFTSRIDMEKEEEMLRKNDKKYKERNTRRNNT